MPQVESIDWDGKLVFLHQDTVTVGVSGILIYAEIRDEIFANTSLGQGYFPPLTKEGGVSKGPGSFTPTFTQWGQSWRLVPHPNGGTAYQLDILDEIISLDGLSDRDVFDRSSIATNVDIDSVYDPVEVKEVATAGGLTEQDKADIAARVWDHTFSGLKARSWLHLIFSAVLAKVSGVTQYGTPGTLVFRNKDDTQDAIEVANDGIGNRTSVTVINDPET